MYGHALKVTDSVKIFGVRIDSHLNMNQHIERMEKASLVSRMRIVRLNSINASLLIRLYKTFTRIYMDYACTALTVLNKTRRQKLEVIQNRSLSYARRTVDSTCIINNALRSYCNIVTVGGAKFLKTTMTLSILPITIYLTPAKNAFKCQ